MDTEETKEDDTQTQKPVILFVDDDEPILKSLKRFGRSRDWTVLTAISGAEALDVASTQDIDIVCSDMRMPNMNGAELLNTFREKHPKVIRILLTGYSDITMLESAINDAHIYNYLTKPWDDTMLAEVISGAIRFKRSESERERLKRLTEEQNKKLSKLALLLDKRVKERDIEVEQALHLLQGSHEQSRVALFEAFEAINRVLEWRESHTQGRSEFVTHHAVAIAQQLKLSDTDIEAIKLGAILHRVGMAALPEDIRMKPIYALSKDEMALYQQYPLLGEQCLAHAQQLSGVSRIVRHHREYINGRGFPDGLIDKDIPIAAQIIGLVTDFYDAYTGHIDKSIQGLQAGLTYIQEWAGKHHDTGLVNVLCSVLEDLDELATQSRVCVSSDLKPGMVLQNDLTSKSGVLLLTKDTEINNSHITKLLDYEHTHREIFEITVMLSNSVAGSAKKGS